jgi:hypothetical protein
LNEATQGVHGGGGDAARAMADVSVAVVLTACLVEDANHGKSHSRYFEDLW